MVAQEPHHFSMEKGALELLHSSKDSVARGLHRLPSLPRHPHAW